MIIAKKRDYWPTNEWKELSPESVGIDTNKLSLVDKEIEIRLNGVNSFLIIKNGYIIHEKYFNGYNQEKTNHLCSVTKTIISALIGIAIEKRLIKSVNQKIFDFFPDFKFKASDYLKSGLSIKHLLTMTTGLLWNSKAHEPMIRRLEKHKNWVDFILKLPIKDNMFERFQYSSAVSHLLSAIITKTSNLSALEFAEKYLFKPIGIPNNIRKDSTGNCFNISWMKDPQGINIGGYGLKLTPRNMAKFGFLYINQGVWNDKQIIPKKWILESIRDYGAGYGYHVWITKIKNFNCFMAAGYGGQFIAGFPELDLIIVITSNADLRRWRKPHYIIDRIVNNFF